MTSENIMLTRRDAKAKPHLEQYAPVWLVEQKIFPHDDAVQFNVVFQHHEYGWVNRRYRYDNFNDVLYYKGQIVIPEDEAIRIQEQQPYIEAVVADMPNSYGG